MNLLRTAVLGLFLSTATRADDASIDITLRAFDDIIAGTASMCERLATPKVDDLPVTELAKMPIIVPRRVMELWMEAAPFLAGQQKVPEPAEIFPPGIAPAIKRQDESRIVRENIAVSLNRLLALAHDVAQPPAVMKPDKSGTRSTEEPPAEKRTVKVPRRWVDDCLAERTKLTERITDAAAPPRVDRREDGVFIESPKRSITRVSDADVPESGPVFAAPYGKDGSWNLYQLINNPTTWCEAEAAARKMRAPFGDKEIRGHLASIHSQGENAFVTRICRGVFSAWIGLNDRRLEAGLDKLGTWEWSSGEPVTWRAWAETDPGSTVKVNGTVVDEDAVALSISVSAASNAVWRDLGDGADGSRCPRVPYVVEWNLNAPKPPEGAKVPEPVFPEGLPGPAGGEGKFGVRIAYGGTSCFTLKQAAEHFASGKGRIVETTLPFLNHRDPDRKDYTQRIADALPLPEQEPEKVDQNFAMLCRGRIRVPESGTYTFGIQHDDGFALRIKGAKWKAAHGWGVIDPADPSVLMHYSTAQLGNTHGVIDLAAGDYDIECFYFQGNYEAYIQLYAAKGEFSGDVDTTEWRLIGHKSNGKIGIPRLSDDGLEIEATPPGTLEELTFTAAEQALAERGKKSEKRTSHTWFNDPDKNFGGNDPGIEPFPGGEPGKDDDNFAFRAKGTLVIPADGTYWLGMHAANGARFRIAGQKWKRLVLSGPGNGSLNGDVMENSPDDSWGNRMVGEIELKAGTYPFEVLSVHGQRAAMLSLFAMPAGAAFAPLKTGVADIVDDRDGLQLVK